MKVNIRHPKPNDYSEITDLDTEKKEKKETFISKIEGCYEGCFIAELDGIIGYIISFPYAIGKKFPINNFFEPINDPNCWYIYDLCVSKDFRGKGIGTSLTKEVLENSWNVVCLTAMGDANLLYGTVDTYGSWA